MYFFGIGTIFMIYLLTLFDAGIKFFVQNKKEECMNEVTIFPFVREIFHFEEKYEVLCMCLLG